MNATRSKQIFSRQPTAIHMLAHLLERLDRSAEAVGADQYQSGAQQLGLALENAEPGAALDVLLENYPAAAELYENQRYQHAGLCRSPLDASLEAELQTRDAMEKARHTSGFTNRGFISGKK